jgi:hypothetical protein
LAGQPFWPGRFLWVIGRYQESLESSNRSAGPRRQLQRESFTLCNRLSGQRNVWLDDTIRIELEMICYPERSVSPWTNSKAQPNLILYLWQWLRFFKLSFNWTISNISAISSCLEQVGSFSMFWCNVDSLRNHLVPCMRRWFRRDLRDIEQLLHNSAPYDMSTAKIVAWMSGTFERNLRVPLGRYQFPLHSGLMKTYIIDFHLEADCAGAPHLILIALFLCPPHAQFWRIRMQCTISLIL